MPEVDDQIMSVKNDLTSKQLKSHDTIESVPIYDVQEKKLFVDNCEVKEKTVDSKEYEEESKNLMDTTCPDIKNTIKNNLIKCQLEVRQTSHCAINNDINDHVSDECNPSQRNNVYVNLFNIASNVQKTEAFSNIEEINEDVPERKEYEGESNNFVDTVDTDKNSVIECQSEVSQISYNTLNDNLNNYIPDQRNVMSQIKEKAVAISSLGAIAVEYESSDSDTEDVNCTQNLQEQETSMVVGQTLQSYRVVDKSSSSSEETDSEDDSSSSSSTSDISSLSSNDTNSDNENDRKGKGNIKVQSKEKEIRNELDDLPPIEDLKISVPEVLCDPLGEVAWMVEQLVVVRPKPGKPTLNLDTVLFMEKGRKALGKIFDVFGQVNEPHYCVRFNNTEDIKEKDIKIGIIVYYCPNTPYTSLVFLHELIKMKGFDTTGDDESPEFSDDEEERVYYEALKQKQLNKEKNVDVPHKRKRITSPTRGWQSNHPWNRDSQPHMMKKQGCHAKRNNRRLPATESRNPSYNSWPHMPYQSDPNWSQLPRQYPMYDEHYAYSAFTGEYQPVQYTNFNGPGQFYHDSRNNHHTENSLAASCSPRAFFNGPSGFCTGSAPFRCARPTPSIMRFRHPDVPWQSSMRISTPWTSLPPPPPPPPLPSPSPSLPSPLPASNSPSTTTS
ncbi:hypothetical protein KM043_017774 [Ampulex compressa]|nr:hypothetical protein KM043_017774 [Ampulex compressa]